MAKSDVETVTEEKVSKGGVLVRLYFDMQNPDKEKLQPLMAELINEHLLKEPGVVYCYGAIDEPMEKDGMFITNAVLTLLVDNFVPLVGIALRYSPAGIEIIKPSKEMVFKISSLQSMLMDLSLFSLNYSKYVLEKVLKPEDIENINNQINNRIELGRKLLDKRGDSMGSTDNKQ
ncbi:MAG: hypothetical protein M1360_01870 [Candidatus Marsarchaeota archaeon]|jgi:hypothetical protein|nr:hypothetical protein [Candidatus Marsarchaeota archaeon]MCL5418668.1 hypothetical protein [Candidatus Marsarchaeota archaeon]